MITKMKYYKGDVGDWQFTQIHMIKKMKRIPDICDPSAQNQSQVEFLAF